MPKEMNDTGKTLCIKGLDELIQTQKEIKCERYAQGFCQKNHGSLDPRFRVQIFMFHNTYSFLPNDGFDKGYFWRFNTCGVPFTF